MTNFFLDTNVLIDFLCDRKPFADDAARLFHASLKKKVKLFVSAVSYNNIYYILRQQNTHAQCLQILVSLNEWTEVLDTTKDVIHKSLHSGFNDFEDAIQYATAMSKNNMRCIVTRNTKDYKKSLLPIMTPGEALKLI